MIYTKINERFAYRVGKYWFLINCNWLPNTDIRNHVYVDEYMEEIVSEHSIIEKKIIFHIWCFDGVIAQ